jgi:hypothetical protein
MDKATIQRCEAIALSHFHPDKLQAEKAELCASVHRKWQKLCDALLENKKQILANADDVKRIATATLILSQSNVLTEQQKAQVKNYAYTDGGKGFIAGIDRALAQIDKQEAWSPDIEKEMWTQCGGALNAWGIVEGHTNRLVKMILSIEPGDVKVANASTTDWSVLIGKL